MSTPPTAPAPPKTRSLRYQVQFLIGALFVVLLIMGASSIWFFEYRSEQAAWQGRQSEAAKNAAATVANTLNRVKTALYWLGNYGDPRNLEDPNIIRTVSSQLPELIELVYVSSDSQIISNAHLDQPMLANAPNMSQAVWFGVARSGTTYVSNIQHSSQAEPFIIMAAPVLRNGNVLAVRLHMQVLWEVINEIRFGSQGQAYVIDNLGNVIAHTNPEVVLEQTNLAGRDEIENMLRATTRSWSGEYVNFEGTSVAGASAPIAGTTWMVVTEVPLTEVYQNSRLALVALVFALLLIALLLTPLVVRIFDRLLVRPLETLRDGAQRIGSGDFDLRMPPLYVKELDQLVGGLNQMAGGLKDRETALSVQHRALEDEIGERVRAEEALKKLNEELEGRVANRTVELSRANEKLKAEIEERRRVEQRYQNLVEQIPAVSYICNLDELLSPVFISPQLEKLLGWNVQEWLSRPGLWLESIHPEDREQVMTQTRAGLDSNTPNQLEYRMHHRDGRLIWVQDNSVALRDRRGKPEYLQGVVLDITARKQAEADLYYNAYHDTLTGLHNRALLIEKLHGALGEHQDWQNEHGFALLFMDLDRFKIINDSLGHRIGDLLLVGIGKRLVEMARPGYTIARLGGDEFVILLEGKHARQDAIRLSDRIMTELRAPFSLENQTVFTTASLGVVIGSEEYKEPEDVLRDADIAMYRAKARGRACYEVFATPLRDQMIIRHQLEGLLRDALGRDEFNLYYQPIVNLKDNRVVGFEALIRWITPQHGMIQPGEFMPLAEESGLIHSIDRWVMGEACRQVKAWQDCCASDYPFTISVNLSGSILQQNTVVEMVAEILKRTGLPAGSLKIELTESVFLETSPEIIDQLRQVRELGVQLQIDDFGTGYSSLAYLQRFPITAIKIDRSFISRIDSEYGGTEIVQAVIVLAKELGLETIAEGIETLSQLRWLKEAGCDYGQGYLLYKPMDSESAGNLLTRIASHNPA